MSKVLSNETLIINDVVVGYVNNTVEDEGKEPESKLVVSNLGGGQVETHLTTDTSTQIGKIKFEVHKTQEALNLLKEFKQRSLEGERFIVKYGSLAINNAIMTTKINSSSGAESTIAVEFAY